LTTGSSAVIRGTLIESPGQGQAVELKAESIDILGAAPVEEYALQKKRHSFEFLREIAHLRARTNSFGAVARVRSAMSFAIHRFFQERGFVYVHTPIITGSDCEGAGEMFQVTTLPLDNLPRVNGQIDFSQDFFGKKASLTVSGQLEGEAYASALKKIYAFGPTFRAENSNTSRHLAEFWMIEPEMAFCDIHGNMDTAEEFLKYIFQYVLDTCPDDMDFFDSRISKGLIENLSHIIKSEFKRITYTEAVKNLIESGEKFEFPVKWGIDLQSEHEKFLTEKVYRLPVIITDYPKEIKAFYMKVNDDDKTVRAMDMLVPRLGEIVGGSEREADYGKLKKRITECGLNPDDYWWYLDLRRFGTVPHAGFGLGFERVIQFVTGMQNIRDVIPFPRAVNTLEF
jgi:asparaginyl-tRNA synthetase